MEGASDVREDPGEAVRRLRSRISRLDGDALDLILRDARSYGAWQDRPVTDDDLRALYDLMKWGPTNANGAPARLFFVRSAAAKEKLVACVSANNAPKVAAAPVVTIIAHDLEFWTHLPRLFRERDLTPAYRGDPARAEAQANRNAALQGAYLIIAARALGLDTCGMSGFRNDEVDAAFLAGTTFRSNFLCCLGYGDETTLKERGPRFEFDEVCRII